MMQKIRLMFVVLQLDAGGSERVVLELARNLDPSHYEVYVAAFKGGALKSSLEKVCKDIFFIEKKSGFDISAILHLAKLVKKNRIDIVNAHHFMPCFYCFFGTRIINHKALVYTEHSVPEVEEIISGIHGKIFFWMLFRINAVIGVSKAITEKFKSSYGRHCDKFYEILNGVDIEKHALREFRENVRESWGFSQSHFVVGTVANFKKVKNHACLIRAVSLLKDSHPNLRLLFVGRGFPGDSDNTETEVRNLINDLGLGDRVVFTGYRENIPEMLSMLDAFCLPSLSEGLPVSVLEAMAVGVPVVGSQVQGIVEIVKDRDTGLLFSPDDHIHLAFILKEIMSSGIILKGLVRRAFDFLQAAHSKEVWIKKTSEVFIKAMQGR